MELIKPDGEPLKKEDKPEDAKGAEAKKEEDKPPVLFSLKLEPTTGIMDIRISMLHVAQSTERMDQFVGFFERAKSIGLNYAVQQNQAAANMKAQITKQSNMNGMRKFLNKKLF